MENRAISQGNTSLAQYLLNYTCSATKKTVVIGCEDRLTHLQVSSLNLVLISENMYSTRVNWVELRASLHS